MEEVSEYRIFKDQQEFEKNWLPEVDKATIRCASVSRDTDRAQAQALRLPPTRPQALALSASRAGKPFTESLSESHSACHSAGYSGHRGTGRLGRLILEPLSGAQACTFHRAKQERGTTRWLLGQPGDSSWRGDLPLSEAESSVAGPHISEG